MVEDLVFTYEERRLANVLAVLVDHQSVILSEEEVLCRDEI